MIHAKRAAVLLGTCTLLVTLFLLRNVHPSWRTVAPVIGLGDLVSDEENLSHIPVPQPGDLGTSTMTAPGEFQTIGTSSEPVFPPGIAKPPGSNYTKTLVITKTKEEDTDWVDEEDLGDVTKMIYVVDDPDAILSTPKNKGHEVMVYLSYIIENYEDLPDVSIFMHAHRFSWHNNDILNNDAVEMISRLSSERVTREGYMNLRCHWLPGCPDWMHPGTVETDAEKQEETMIAEAWAELFADHPIPEVLAQPCCAQFALSKQRIRSIPREKFLFYREWLTRTPIEDKFSGRIWEYLWQAVFTGHSVFCPDQFACYCDGYGVCFQDAKEFDYWFESRWHMKAVEKELAQWLEKADKVDQYRKNGVELVGIEGGELEVPEPGKDVELRTRIQEFGQQLEELRMAAVERGVDPKIRAWSSGRSWKEGDWY